MRTGGLRGALAGFALVVGMAVVSACAGAAGQGAGAGESVPAGGFIIDTGREPDEVLALWPEGPPGGEGVALQERLVERDNPFGLRDRAAHDVVNPVISLFAASEPDGSAILIIPGGGYAWVVVDKEGYEGARWFSRQGSDVWVLRYRLPHQGWAAGADAPLQDAQRAMRLIRSRAQQDGVDPRRVMVMGFSAGGHLAGSLATRFAEPVYAPVDGADTLSARPDLAVLVYPVVSMQAQHAHPGSRLRLIGEAPAPERVAAYSLETRVPGDAPALFVMHAADDTAVPVENARLVHEAWRAAGLSAALHVFAQGGHGFGLRGIEGTPLAAWPELVRDWADSQGFADAAD